MIEAVLVHLLLKKGILTKDEVVKMLNLRKLYSKLVSVGELEPLSVDDLKIIDEIEVLSKSKETLEDKLVKLRRLGNRAESTMLKGIISKTLDDIKKVIDE